jgi:hypothetical protein
MSSFLTARGWSLWGPGVSRDPGVLIATLRIDCSSACCSRDPGVLIAALRIDCSSACCCVLSCRTLSCVEFVVAGLV